MPEAVTRWMSGAPGASAAVDRRRLERPSHDRPTPPLDVQAQDDAPAGHAADVPLVRIGYSLTLLRCNSFAARRESIRQPKSRRRQVTPANWESLMQAASRGCCKPLSTFFGLCSLSHERCGAPHQFSGASWSGWRAAASRLSAVKPAAFRKRTAIRLDRPKN